MTDPAAPTPREADEAASAESRTPPLLEADSIGRSFRGRRVLNAAYLRAAEGRFTAMVGRNGAGKSTLLKICAGLLAADHGTVRYAGRVRERPRLWRLAREGLFVLPADRPLLSRSLPVRTQLRAVARLGGGGDGEVERTAERLGIAEGLGRTPDRLSGGERRRAEVAAALLRRPRCLLADEPLRGVSPADAEEIADVLKGEAERGAAVVVTGHELTWLLPRADEVAWVANGTTRLFASAEEAEADWRFRRDFLGRA